jgi:hypothetical protein
MCKGIRPTRRDEHLDPGDDAADQAEGTAG